MTSIQSLLATTERNLGGPCRPRPGTHVCDPRPLLGCRSKAYMVHLMNVCRLSERFPSYLTFTSVYVAILAATSGSTLAPG